MPIKKQKIVTAPKVSKLLSSWVTPTNQAVKLVLFPTSAKSFNTEALRLSTLSSLLKSPTPSLSLTILHSHFGRSNRYNQGFHQSSPLFHLLQNPKSIKHTCEYMNGLEFIIPPGATCSLRYSGQLKSDLRKCTLQLSNLMTNN